MKRKSHAEFLGGKGAERPLTYPIEVALPPFLRVERVLHLGLKWQISTVIKRLTPPGIPVHISLPLLSGESLTTGGIQVEAGQAIINF